MAEHTPCDCTTAATALGASMHKVIQEELSSIALHIRSVEAEVKALAQDVARSKQRQDKERRAQQAQLELLLAQERALTARQTAALEEQQAVFAEQQAVFEEQLQTLTDTLQEVKLSLEEKQRIERRERSEALAALRSEVTAKLQALPRYGAPSLSPIHKRIDALQTQLSKVVSLPEGALLPFDGRGSVPKGFGRVEGLHNQLVKESAIPLFRFRLTYIRRDVSPSSKSSSD